MPIDATTTTTVNAAYDRWSVANLQISGDGCVAFGQSPPGGPIAITATLVKARVLADGTTWERSPVPGDVCQLSIADAYAYIAAGTPPALAVQAAMNAIISALEAVGTDQKKL